MTKAKQFGSYIRQLREKKGYTVNQLSLYSGVSSAQISRIENGLRGVPKPETIKKLSEALGHSYEDLMQAAGYLDDNAQPKLPELTEKDERDIQKELERLIRGLKTGSGFTAFGGMDIDELDEEDRELLIASLENSLRLAKRIAKQKFTPKKYRKEE
ncbi:helix-turn-helix transcriptional regulator [Geobacillus stearothermophilus]|uniref:Immunity repressor protein, phage-related protein n=2 Tax=Geobacillus TaxID=129337 RepID=A4ISA1_GEOTN|nr:MULTISPECIES: helix-turn-helix transcriptional regulator [Geobacillus]ABO68205.1 Immunity repressor protein, phage-related protein [Geobacillus thermodenitrificans NG80-2]MED3717314.1 helix-turn-helix transcriptional regulator [Geobacillus thermodenitrificans]MED5040840.1 helix-turn-helix transcriptional regulator [Geobacillus stearothermophilus]NNU87988.1 XRE family transcriptional regulator [Geobacillus sp. MR]